jgi:antitoxin component YwqK of YwqJK toxin-antitoxin module
MKKVLISVILMVFGVSAFAQELKYENGLYFKKDMLYTGTHIEYFEDGKISLELNVKNGFEHGNVDYYYTSGSKKEHREYYEGKKTGIWITWNEDNVKLAEAGYKDDVKDGNWFVWDNKGMLLYEMHYVMGKKTGTWRQWDESGKLIMERDFGK